MPEPTSDPFRSLRDVARPAEPDPAFVASVLRDVQDRLGAPSGARPPIPPTDSADRDLVPLDERLDSPVRSSRSRTLTAAAVAAVIAGGLITIATARDEPVQPVSDRPAPTTALPPTTSTSTTVPCSNPPAPTRAGSADPDAKERTLMHQTSRQEPLTTTTAMIFGAAAAALALGGCGGDDSTSLANGSDVELVGDQNLGGQTLDVRAEEEDGDVTGELRFRDATGEVVVTVECADTKTDGVVVLGGTITDSTDEAMTGLAALFIKEGEPDRVAVWLDEGDNETCSDLLVNRHDVLDDDSLFVEVEDDSDIETG
jgi:hypothetical protein